MQSAWILPTSWWLRSALGGGLLLLVVWVLMWRVRQPARRQRLGEWGVVAALLAAVLSAGPTWLPLHVLPEGATFAWLSEGDAAPTPTLSVTPLDDEGNADGLLWTDAVAELPPSVPDTASQAVTPPAAPAPEPRFSWTALVPSISRDQLAVGLLAVYVLGALVLSGRWLYGCMVLVRFLRGCEPVPDQVAALFADMTRHWKRPPRLLMSGRLRVPVSCGLWRPTVVLPIHFVAPDDAPRLRWALVHELTHLERRDPWSCLLFSLAQGIYFYCPWFWWLRRQVRLCQEFIADAAAARQAGLAEDYAQFLVSLAEAPAGPRVAIGVVGQHSDLFRRITMLVQNPLRIESACPWRWSLATLAGLVAVAVCASGLGLYAADPDKPADKTPAPARPQERLTATGQVIVVVESSDGEQLGKVEVKADDFGDLRKALDRLPPGPETDKLKKDILKQMEALKANRPPAPGGFVVNTSTAVGGRRSARLGVTIGQMTPVLTEQLDLPHGKGVLIANVLPGQAAAKAGFKPNDILMELDGKSMPSNIAEFFKQLNDIKADTAVDAVVIRKGKKETLKGVKLPEGKDEIRQLRAVNIAPAAGGLPGLPGARPVPAPRAIPAPGGVLPVPAARPIGPLPGIRPATAVPVMPGFGGVGTNGVMTTIFRNDEQFTGRHQEGSLIISVTGKVADGKSKLTEIVVQDGQTGEKYDSLGKVPERYRDKAKSLIEMAEKGAVKVESRSGARRTVNPNVNQN